MVSVKYYGEKWFQLSTMVKKVQLSTMAIKVRSRSIELKLVLKKTSSPSFRKYRREHPNFRGQKLLKTNEWTRTDLHTMCLHN